MKRNAILVSLAASLFVVAGAAQADRSGVLLIASAVGSSMEDVRSEGTRTGLESHQAIDLVFPTQGPAD